MAVTSDFLTGLQYPHALERSAPQVVRALGDVLRETLGADPARVAAFLEISGGSDWTELLLASARYGVGSSRCDAIETAAGWAFIEVNAMNAGGWLTTTESGRAAGAAGERYEIAECLFEHLVEVSLARAACHGRAPVIALVVAERGEFDDAARARCRVAFARALARRCEPRSSTLTFVRWSDLAFDGDAVRAGGVAIDLLFEADLVEAPPRLRALMSALAGDVQLVPGPFAQIANDKRLFALLSEEIDAARLGSWAAVAPLIAWSRIVRPGRVERAGVSFDLVETLLRRRSELVLKKALSAGGEGVVVGHALSTAQWEQVVERALRERDWIVQEWAQPVEHAIPGMPPAHVVWGPFVIGDAFGGAIARIVASDGYRPAMDCAAGIDRLTIAGSSNADARARIVAWGPRERAATRAACVDGARGA